MSDVQCIPKGYRLEEVLRTYFLKAGYYVIRSVPFAYGRFDVTDIDIWLYNRSSSVSREIIVVDAKNRTTPKAIERIFWVQGLQKAVRATSAIVATTERRPEVKQFGLEQGILVLDGNFLSRIQKAEDTGGRLTEEQFMELIRAYVLGKIDGDWPGRVMVCKKLLSTGLSFDACNEWLHHAQFFAEQSLVKPKQRETALRCLYLICSFVAIAIDYLLKDLSFLEQAERTEAIEMGFTYGSSGRNGMKRTLDIAMALVEQHAKGGAGISAQVRRNVQKELASFSTSVLGEFFGRNEITKNLFVIAKELEALSMRQDFVSHDGASVGLRSMLYILLDYWNIDRQSFTSSSPEVEAQNECDDIPQELQPNLLPDA